MGTDDYETIRVLIHGKVQGVFFRSTLKNFADSLGLTGWTRNLLDGTVECLLQGRPADLKRALEWCRKGPKMARVEEIELFPVTNNNRYANFTILT